jgi:hypothetical protein
MHERVLTSLALILPIRNIGHRWLNRWLKLSYANKVIELLPEKTGMQVCENAAASLRVLRVLHA